MDPMRVVAVELFIADKAQNEKRGVILNLNLKVVAPSRPFAWAETDLRLGQGQMSFS